MSLLANWQVREEERRMCAGRKSINTRSFIVRNDEWRWDTKHPLTNTIEVRASGRILHLPTR